MRLDEDGENVVLDAIHILNSKQICLRVLQQECDDDPAAENIDKVTNILVKARNKAIGEVSTILSSHVTYNRHPRILVVINMYFCGSENIADL
jgi:hypothetical protein